MRVTLIAPPFSGSSRGLPLGLAYLATVLERNGFGVSILDMTVGDPHEDLLPEFLAWSKPDLIGISSNSATYLDAIDTARRCRNLLKSSVKILLGGQHATIAAEIILKNHPLVDLCVIGEAEETVVAICKSLDSKTRSLNSVSGIVFQNNTALCRTAPRKMCNDLDTIPLPERVHFQANLYADAVGTFNVGASNKAELIASRGCPFQCQFCSTSEFWGRTYRKRSPANVVHELDHLVSLGFTDIYFHDDTFTCERDWVVSLCNMINERELKIRWACGTRVDLIDNSLLSCMKDAGCVYIYFGVESGDVAINALQRKGTTLGRVEAAYEMLHSHGIYSSAALIFGLPGETLETAIKTVKWVRDVLRPEEVWISKAACYPNTLLAKRYSVSPSDYEYRINGSTRLGLPYGTGGIYTPFFRDVEIVRRVWDFARNNLSELNVGFGDDHGEPTVKLEQ